MDGNPLDELEIDCVTITRDGEGIVTVDGGGLTRETVSHLLLLGVWVHAASEFDEASDDDAV